MNKNLIASLSATILGVTGCSSSPPDCADKTVQETVIELMDKKTQIGYNMGVQLGMHLSNIGIKVDPNKVSFKLEAIRTKSTEKDVNRSACVANINILYDGKAYFEKPINYTAQLTDNKKDVYVELK